MDFSVPGCRMIAPRKDQRGVVSTGQRFADWHWHSRLAQDSGQEWDWCFPDLYNEQVFLDRTKNGAQRQAALAPFL
jgi:hypothetical protein